MIVSHGHGDHHGGAKLLQDRFGARLVMGADDWALVERDTRSPRPKRDIVATDGMEIRVGNQKVTLFLTPAIRSGRFRRWCRSRTAAATTSPPPGAVTSFGAATPREQVNLYVNSASRFRDIVGKAGADIIIANHTMFDGTLAKTAALAKRRPEDPHPYVIGKETVSRYLTVAEECAKAELAGS